MLDDDPAQRTPGLAPSLRVVLVRHGETLWSREGRHTGRTEVQLEPEGRLQATELAPELGRGGPFNFARVLTSPRSRAIETCRLAGLGGEASVVEDLAEWDYGEYEGRTREQILAERRGWDLWRDGCPGGEAAADVARRVDRVIADLRARLVLAGSGERASGRGGAEGDAVLFAHGHVLRVLAARWIGERPELGSRLKLDPATLSVLAYERDAEVILRWNAPPPPAPVGT